MSPFDFENAEIFRLEEIRNELISSVSGSSLQELLSSSVAKPGALDLLLGEALYQERQRIRRNPGNWFTRSRNRADSRLWASVQSGLLRSPGEVERKALLESVLKHYGEEICGHFDRRYYRFATQAVPWGLSWLLNAVSFKRLMPKDFKTSVQAQIRLSGEIEHLRKLAQKGTVLLVPTHQSNLDSLLIGFVIYLLKLPPFSYGAGLNLFTNPVLSLFMSKLGAYTVDRRKSNDIYKSVLKTYSNKILERGIHSVFFPGGGRSRSGAIESKLKLGLMGTALDAQIGCFQSAQAAGKPLEQARRIFVVPMITSYNFVLEASSLIEDELADVGKSRYIIMDDESWQPGKVLGFLKKVVLSESGIAVRIGKPMDVFGNLVDWEGRSQGPNQTEVDPIDWLTSSGELIRDRQRDQEYTRLLGNRVVQRFHRDQLVIPSHVVAFAAFEAMRRKYPDLDLFRFLRLSPAQRALSVEDFREATFRLRDRLVEKADADELHLAPELRSTSKEAMELWLDDGIRQLGLMHDVSVIKIDDGVVNSEDMNLLYYYRNRLSGYGLSLLASDHTKGARDGKGFLV